MVEFLEHIHIVAIRSDHCNSFHIHESTFVKFLLHWRFDYIIHVAIRFVKICPGWIFQNIYVPLWPSVLKEQKLLLSNSVNCSTHCHIQSNISNIKLELDLRVSIGSRPVETHSGEAGKVQSTIPALYGKIKFLSCKYGLENQRTSGDLSAKNISTQLWSKRIL